MIRSALALAIGAGLTLTSCTGGSSSSSSSDTEPPSSPDTTTPPEWATIDRALAELGPNVGFLAAAVTPDGTCDPIHEIERSTARPTGSQFKLFVLGALADQITGGQTSWDQTLTVQDATMSLGNGDGSLQVAAPGTRVTVEEAATKMISISDNTATDMLIGLIGRDEVAARAGRWTADRSANEPFLTTREMLLLHYVPGLADRYLATTQDDREAFLASSVAPLPVGAIAAGYTDQPRYIDTVEWFASPDGICRAFAGLQELAEDPQLAPLSTVLSRATGGIEPDPSGWATVWYKGGSEPGVLTLGWLATNNTGGTFVVQAMVSDPDAPLPPNAIDDLAALAEQAFELLD